MHCFRRAALRLTPSATFVPARARPVTTLNVRRSALAPRSTSSLLQRRWNSNEAPKQPELNTTASAEAEAEAKAEPKNADVAAAEEEDAQVAVDAAHAVGAASTRPDQLTDREAMDEPRASADYKKMASDLDNSLMEYGDAEPQRQQWNRRRSKVLAEEPDPIQTVYVGNLFYDLTAQDLRTEMERYGVVENCIIIVDSRGMSKGFGYVQFESTEVAMQARNDMDGKNFEGRRVSVKYAKTNVSTTGTANTPSRTLYIGNIAFDLTEQDINDLFLDIPNIIDVRVSVDRRTGMPRGFAHAEFLDKESAKLGLESLSTMAPFGRRLRVDYSNDNRPVRAVQNGNAGSD